MSKLLCGGITVTPPDCGPQAWTRACWEFIENNQMGCVFVQMCIFLFFHPLFSFSHTVSAPSVPVSPCWFPPAWPRVSGWALASCVAPGKEAWMSGSMRRGSWAWGGAPEITYAALCRTWQFQTQEAVIRTRGGLTLRSSFFFFSPASLCRDLQRNTPTSGDQNS